MITSFIRFGFLLFCFALSPLSLRAEAPVESPPSELLLAFNLMMSMEQGSLSPADIEFFIKRVDLYFSKDSHKKFLTTPDGKKLLALKARLKRGKGTQETLEKCLADKSLAQAFGTSLKSELQNTGLEDCELTHQSGLSEVMKSTEAVLAKLPQKNQAKNISETLEELARHAYQNTVQTYIELKNLQGHADDFLTNGKLDSDKFDESAKKLFLKNPKNRGIETGLLFSLKDHANRYITSTDLTGRAGAGKPQEMLDHMGQYIEFYNEAGRTLPAEQLPVEEQLGHIGMDGKGYTPEMHAKYKTAQKWLAAERETRTKALKQVQDQHDAYNEWSKQTMAEIVASPAGLLMFTDKLAPYFRPRITSTDNYHEVKAKLPAGKAGEKLINSSIESALTQTEKFGHFISDNSSHLNGFGQKVDETTLRERLKKLVMASPAAVAQTLASRPESVGLICQLMNEIGQDKSEAKNEAYLWGGMIVGAAGALTLVSGPIGLTALAAGTSWALALESAAATALIGGTAMSMYDLSHNLQFTQQLQTQSSALRTSFIASGSKDFIAYSQLNASMIKLKSAMIDNYAMTATVLLDLGYVVRHFKAANDAQKLLAMRRGVEFSQEMGKSGIFLPMKAKLGPKGLQDLLSLSVVHSTENPKSIFLAVSKLTPKEAANLTQKLSELKKSKSSGDIGRSLSQFLKL